MKWKNIDPGQMGCLQPCLGSWLISNCGLWEIGLLEPLAILQCFLCPFGTSREFRFLGSNFLPLKGVLALA